MVIEVVLFFLFVLLFVVVGGVIAWMMRRKRRTETEVRTGWPLRNWIVMIVVLAIFVPLVYHWVHVAAQKEAHRESLEQKAVNGGTGSSSPAGGAVPPGDSARPGSVVPGATPVNNVATKDVNDSIQKGSAGGKGTAARAIPTAKAVGKDTSYHVATPPQH